jgi:hypothetical protein
MISFDGVPDRKDYISENTECFRDCEYYCDCSYFIQDELDSSQFSRAKEKDCLVTVNKEDIL